MKYIKLYESWIQGKKHRFKDREEFEKQVLAFLSQSDRFELDYSNGDILNLDLRKYNEEDDTFYYENRDWAIEGNIEDDHIRLGDETFIYDAMHKDIYDWAKQFQSFLIKNGISNPKMHNAQTGTIYVTFISELGDEYKVRFADHPDVYGESDFNFACTEDNLDGGDWNQLVHWFRRLNFLKIKDI
jgi:hypothetical protein